MRPRAHPNTETCHMAIRHSSSRRYEAAAGPDRRSSGTSIHGGTGGSVVTRSTGEQLPERHMRHPFEVPFFIFMVVLNVLIILAILSAASTLPFLPDAVRESAWGTTIRSALIALLLLIPGLVIVRETQRASVRGTAVELSPRQYPELYDTAHEFAHIP